MSVKNKALAAAAALTMAGSLGAAGAMTANAATPSCGHKCIDLFSRVFGTHKHPAFVLDVLRQGQKVGQPIVLFQTSNSDPGEDFTVAQQGTVHAFFKAGLVTSALNLHYSKFEAYEIEYAPSGVESGLCMGVPVTAGGGTKVALEPCGVSSKTLWVVDSYDSIKGFFVPLINGSDTNFSHPYVLEYPANASPTDNPRPQLATQTLQKDSHGVVNDNEMWSANTGVLP